MGLEERHPDIAAPLLAVRGLEIGIERMDGSGRVAGAAEDISFDLFRGKTLCLVGESGCGKSVTALSLLRLLPSPPVRVLGGEAFFEGKDLLALDDEELRHVRGNRIGMVFQEPMNSLNPVMTVGRQIEEALLLHKKISRAEARREAVASLSRVGIPNAEARAADYPHQMSGGMRQRAMIAMAMSCRPRLLIADEPTTALDVTMQKQILRLMRELMEETDGSLLLITHDIGVVAQMADDVAVMYSGKIVEQGGADDVLGNPKHPYTQGLLRSRPALAAEPRRDRLETIAGHVPGLWDRPPGCAFHPRCPFCFSICRTDPPPFFQVEGRKSRCWLNQPPRPELASPGGE